MLQDIYGMGNIFDSGPEGTGNKSKKWTNIISSKITGFCIAKRRADGVKRESTEWKKYLQVVYLISYMSC